MDFVILFAVCEMIIDRLLGHMPFWHKSQMVSIRSILQCEYSFEAMQFNEVSIIAKDLVCLVYSAFVIQ